MGNAYVKNFTNKTCSWRCRRSLKDKRIILTVACLSGAYSKMRSAHKVIVGKPEGMRPLGRYRRRQEYNIKMDVEEIGWEGVN
jgi:hypothetical protein